MRKIYLLLLILVAFSSAANAQKLFVRLYDSNDKKIAKGFLIQNSDTTIIAIQNADSVDKIPVQKVAYVNTKRTVGHSILVGALIGAPVGALIGGLSASTAGDVANAYGEAFGVGDVSS